MSSNLPPTDNYRQAIKESIPVLEAAIKNYELAIYDAKAVGQDMSEQELKLADMKRTLAAYKAQFG